MKVVIFACPHFSLKDRTPLRIPVRKIGAQIAADVATAAPWRLMVADAGSVIRPRLALVQDRDVPSQQKNRALWALNPRPAESHMVSASGRPFLVSKGDCAYLGGDVTAP